MTQNPFMKEVLDFVGDSPTGRTRGEIVRLIDTRTELSGQTPERRFVTVKAWLVDTGLIVEDSGRFEATAAQPTFGKAEISSTASILEGTPDPFKPEHMPDIPLDVEPDEVQRMVDAAKTERANTAHETLRIRIANNAGANSYSTRTNGYIDVCCVRSDRVVIHEVKSATEANFLSQVRHAVSQLYEYRYTQNLPDAELCLVIEIPPPTELEWVVDYLYDDRNIAVIFLTQGDSLVEPEGRGEAMSDFTD